MRPPTAADGKANSVDPDHSNLIRVYTVCSELSVPKYSIISDKVSVSVAPPFNLAIPVIPTTALLVVATLITASVWFHRSRLRKTLKNIKVRE